MRYRSANSSNANNSRNVSSTGANNNNCNNANYFAPDFFNMFHNDQMLVIPKGGKPVSKNNDERNAYPVCGQTQATESLATKARESVCAITKMLAAEKRTHRNVGYKNSVSRFHMLAMTKCNAICNELLTDTYRPAKGEKYEVSRQ